MVQVIGVYVCKASKYHWVDSSGTYDLNAHACNFPIQQNEADSALIFCLSTPLKNYEEKKFKETANCRWP